MGSPLPSVNTVFNLISQEESHRSLASGNDKFVYAFTAKKQFKSNAENLNLKCSHCGSKRHLVDRCFHVISFPNKGTGGKNIFVKSKSSSAPRFNKPVNNFVTCDFDNKSKSITLTPEMYDQLFKLLNAQKMDENVTVNMTGVLVNSICFNSLFCGWIFHSGATNHMIFYLNILFNLKNVSKENVPVNLPNESFVLVKYIGKCFLTLGLVLKTVLYVPNFKSIYYLFLS